MKQLISSDGYRLPPRAVIGLEAEFKLLINDLPQRPEKIFGTPQKIVRARMLPRTGRSFQLPAGGAIYFDTGVIEIATPIVELDRGCCFRATRLLWEQLRFLRRELDHWSRRHRCRVRLEGFSTHYNISFQAPDNLPARTAGRLAFLLAHVVPAPLALLAANRSSTAIGVRPRGTRIEITTDFTPDPSLMLAACSFAIAAAETIRSWPNYDVEQLERHHLPRLTPFRLRKHCSRRGWRTLPSSLAHNPFTTDPNARVWTLRDGRVLNLREVAGETLVPFTNEVRRLSDPATLRHIRAVFAGDARSLLDFSERPGGYDDAGHTFDWNRRRIRHWPRSAYERVIPRVIVREPIRVGGRLYRVHRMRGWYEVVCREAKTGRQRIFTLDELVQVMASKKAPKSRRA